MKKKRLLLILLAALAVITLVLTSTAFAATIAVSTRSCTSYFQVYNGTEWHDYTAPQHYITGTSPEQIAYCLQQTKSSPNGSSYSTTDVLNCYSARTSLGLQIILENGYPFTTPSGLSTAEARYATANALRFWLAEEGDAYQYNYCNLSAYSDAQLRSYAAAGKIGSKVRTVSSSYNDVLQFSIELLIAARSQTVPPHTISFSPSTLNLSYSGGSFVGTTAVTLNNMKGGYTLNTSALPSGASVSGYTGNSGDVLTIRIPVSAGNSNRTIQLSAAGYDDRTRTNIFVYAPSSSTYQKMLTATVGQSYMENVGNANLSVVTPSMPDLVVSSLTPSQSSYDATATVSVTATVTNQGTGSAGGFSVTLAPSGLSAQTVGIGSLAAGASQNVTFTFSAPVYTSNTAMTLTATADSAGSVLELDEGNNSRSTSITILAARPDLDITALTTNKSTYDAGETVTVTATVANIGLVSAPGHILRLAPGFLAVQDKAVGALAPGASATVTYTFTAPINTTATNMTLVATADPGNAIVESNETNNTASRSISIGAVLPDLDITALTTNKSAYDAGEMVTVTATVANIGLVSAPGHTLRLAPGSLAVQDKAVGALAPGASATVTYTFTAPTNTTATSMTLTATADSGNAIAESDETNNTASRSISIGAGLPDLDITALTTDQSTYDAGATVTITAVVKNIGLVSAPSHTLRLAPGSLAAQDKAVAALAPGASATVTYTFTAPTSASASSMTLTATADPANAIAEQNEANNSATATISIRAALPDLDIASITTNRATYDAGETVTVTVVEKNIGLTSAPSHTLRLAPGSLAVQNKTVIALAPSASVTVTYTFTAPTLASASSMTLTATADPANAIAEQNEDNNSASVTISIRAALPDLDVTSITTNKATYDAGETVTVTAVEKNIGLTSAPSHTLRLAPGSLSVQDKTISALAPGATATAKYTFVTQVKSTAFSMTLTATADATNAVTEADETNNTASVTITVNAGLPDLTVTGLSTDKTTYEAGETVTVTATVANQGLTSVGSTTIRLSPGSLQTQDKTVASIAAGASTSVSWTFAAPSNLTSSSLMLTVTADPRNTIAESDETNNSRSMSIGVNAIRPDITIIDANTADWYGGKDVLVSATVKNLSAQPVPSVKIRLKAGSVQVDETVCVPANGSNLAVFRFTVPIPPSPPGTVSLAVTITADPDNTLTEVSERNNAWTKTQTISCVPVSNVIDPDSQALEQGNLTRNRIIPPLPSYTPSAYCTWQEVRLMSGSYVIKTFWAQLSTVFILSPDPRIAYADRPDQMESGFGVQASCRTTLTTNYDHAEKLVGPQLVWVYSPESTYGQGLWQNVRDSLEKSSGNAGEKTTVWQYATNPYSTAVNRLHYTPLWFPDGRYTALAQAFYAWSPVGQMVDYQTDIVTIQGDMYDRVITVRQ